jgi:hypothetical protein
MKHNFLKGAFKMSRRDFREATIRAIRLIGGVSLALLILAPAVNAGSTIPNRASGRLFNTGNIKVSSSTISSIPDKIVGSNRMVVGFTFRGFNFKKIYPYFSMDIKNAHNPSFHPIENHHLYSGLLLLGLGKITGKHYLRTIGTVLIVDDLVEHSFNVQSGLGFIANKIDHQLYAKITASADRLFK